MACQDKRVDYITWEEYFMGLALLSAQRSKDPHTQVGACIVNEKKRIVGLGYNGFPDGVSDDEFPWGKKSKHPYVVHAEENAVLNKFSIDLNDCTIYVTLFPCNKCAQVLIQSGIKRIVFLNDKQDKEEMLQARELFNAVGIEYKKFESTRKITIDFEDKPEN